MTEPLKLEAIVVLGKLTNGEVVEIVVSNSDRVKSRVISLLEDDAYPGKIKIAPVGGIEIN